jgi:hypothetical protein
MRVGNARRWLLRRWWVLTLAVGAGLAGTAAWGIGAHQPRLPHAGPPPALSPRTVMPPMPAVLPVGAESIQIPSLSVTAEAMPETVRAGQLGVPADSAQVGWWMPSTSELVIDGHVDTAAGPGALYLTSILRPGAAVTVETATGTEHWTIDGVRTYLKGYMPAGLFGGYSPRLMIITCGGPFDYVTHHYYDNVVAYASPAHS